MSRYIYIPTVLLFRILTRASSSSLFARVYILYVILFFRENNLSIPVGILF